MQIRFRRDPEKFFASKVFSNVPFVPPSKHRLRLPSSAPKPLTLCVHMNNPKIASHFTYILVCCHATATPLHSLLSFGLKGEKLVGCEGKQRINRTWTIIESRGRASKRKELVMCSSNCTWLMTPFAGFFVLSPVAQQRMTKKWEECTWQRSTSSELARSLARSFTRSDTIAQHLMYCFRWQATSKNIKLGKISVEMRKV